MLRHRTFRCLLAAAALVFASSTAMAQGAYWSDPFPYKRQYKWSGLYVGFQGGYSASRIEAVSGPYGGPFDQTYAYWSEGLFGGAHLGYNWQNGHYLFGLETDIDVGNTNAHGTGSLGYAHQSHIDWQSTIRARLGWISGPWLTYATGGIAFSQTSVAKTLPLALSPFASATDRFVGWTIGLGAERAINQDTTLRFEYRYTDFGTAEFANAVANTVDRMSMTTHSLRAGVSFKF